MLNIHDIRNRGIGTYWITPSYTEMLDGYCVSSIVWWLIIRYEMHCCELHSVWRAERRADQMKARHSLVAPPAQSLRLPRPTALRKRSNGPNSVSLSPAHHGHAGITPRLVSLLVLPSLAISRHTRVFGMKRLLPVLVIMQGIVKAAAAAGSNSSAFILRSAPNLNASPFGLYDDRPDDCPPWYALVSAAVYTYPFLVSTVYCPHLSAITALRATNSTANVNAQQASAETTALNQVSSNRCSVANASLRFVSRRGESTRSTS